MALPRARSTAAGNAEASTFEAESVAGSGTFDLTGVSILPVGGNAPYDVQFRHPTVVNPGTTVLIGDGSNTTQGGATDADSALIVDAGTSNAGAPGGKLTISAGSAVELRGNGRLYATNALAYASHAGGSGNVIQNDGGTFRFNGMTGKNFNVVHGNTGNGWRRIVGTAGAVFESTAGNGNGYFGVGSACNWDLTDTHLRRLGTAAIDAIMLAPGGGGNSLDARTWFDNVLAEACGRFYANGGPALAVTRFDNFVALDGLHATEDLRLSYSSTMNGPGGGVREVYQIGLERGLYIANRVVDWDIQESVLGLLQMQQSAGTSTQLRRWRQNTYRVNSSASYHLASETDKTDVDDYISTVRTDAEMNPKVMSLQNSIVNTPRVSENIIFELSQPVVVGDLGEILGHHGLSSPIDTRDGWGLRRFINIGCEAGPALTIVEYLGTATGNPGGNAPRLVLDQISTHLMTGGGGVIHCGHSSTREPGTDKVEFTSSVAISGGGTSYFVADLNSGLDGLHTDFMLPAEVRKCAVYGHRADSPRNPDFAGTGWNIANAGDNVAARAAFEANNYIGTNPYAGRVAQPSEYLNAVPGGRRVRTYGAYHGITGGTDDLVWSNTWRALAATRLAAGVHPAYPSGHTYHNANVTPVGLRAWVRADWSYGLVYLANEAGTAGIGATMPDPPEPEPVTASSWRHRAAIRRAASAAARRPGRRRD